MDSNSFIKYNIEYDLSTNVDIDLLKQYNILPIQNNILYILTASSNIHQDLNPITKLLNKPVKLIEVEQNYLDMEYKYLHIKQKLYNNAIQALKHKNIKSENSFILHFIDQILSYAVKINASDIHFEIFKNIFTIRLRVDGILNSFFQFKVELFQLISSVIKFLGNLDISQNRLPLDSRFTKQIDDKDYDFRISTIPTIYGESIVLRILDNNNVQKSLDTIGFDDSILSSIKNTLKLTQGMILVTGPTGSGKTTTLYSILKHLNTNEKKIITVEDPVEYKLDGIIQVNINNDINLDYGTVLKNILRQDPDILMIGEIRDQESLQIAMQASLTGHLVIATLHTNNAAETITRLFDLQAATYLVASTLKMVISQRLVRVLCSHCKEYDKQIKSYIKKGCDRCNFSGYKDRKIVCEVLNIDEDISRLISSNNFLDILPLAKKKNFKELRSNGKKMVEKGTTSLEEYLSRISHEI
ncbi:MAG: GspE/PulE family protein [Campylobacterota bacterium]|nr:GspE/PulE family protein [Campylobacterota bacterium]